MGWRSELAACIASMLWRCMPFSRRFSPGLCAACSGACQPRSAPHQPNLSLPLSLRSYVRYSYFGIALNELQGLVLTCTPEQLA